LFDGVDSVDVTGTTKGRGTAGVMKRHGFKGQRASHGVKKVHRHQGGTSMNTSPARVFKGKRMAGRYGNEQSTMRNLKLVGIDRELNLLLVRGAVPGANGMFVTVMQTNKIKRVGAAAPAGKKKAGGK
jgi:large subunit ribosomal protein L3